jgi:hypothetical protein
VLVRMLIETHPDSAANVFEHYVWKRGEAW